MTEHDDGGPAFPQQFQHDAEGDRVWPEEFGADGMSLRDWFAGQALAGILSADTVLGQRTNPHSDAAMAAYRIADAMLKERSK